jgi:hypothetical protein
MSSRSGWTVAGVLALVLLIFGFSALFAQRGTGPDFRPPPGGVGRYQVVRSNGDVTILLDTVTGDLYNAAPSDIKPFATRWRPPDLPVMLDKGKASQPAETKDLAKDSLKDRIKDELDIKKTGKVGEKDKQ